MKGPLTRVTPRITTYFFPVGEEIHGIVAEWVNYLREEKMWGSDDPLFPATRIVVGATRQFEAEGLERAHWSSAEPIRKVFHEAFERADLPYFNPHSFRNTLAQLGEKLCKSPEDYKAWSQNYGHEKVLTTFMSYGKVPPERQGEIIRGLTLGRPSELPNADAYAEAVVRKLRHAGLEFPADPPSIDLSDNP